MTKKTLQHAFSAELSAPRTKTVDGKVLTAVAVLPPSPFRPTDSRAGLTFTYDAAALIAEVAASPRKRVVDIEHNTERGAGSDTRARGWIHSLTTAEIEPEFGFGPGLYAWVEHNSLGANELADKLYGYTSAVVKAPPAVSNLVVIRSLKSLTYTNNPAAEMSMNFTADAGGYTGDEQLPDVSDMELELLKKLLARLGVDTAEITEATESAAFTAIDALAAPGEAETALTAIGFTAAELTAGAVVKTELLTAATEQVTALTATVESLTTQLSEFTAKQAEDAAVAAVDAAITAGKYTPATRDALLVQARSNLVAFSAVTDLMPVHAVARPAVATQGVDETHGLTAEQLQTCKTHGIDPVIYAKNLRATS